MRQSVMERRRWLALKFNDGRRSVPVMLLIAFLSFSCFAESEDSNTILEMENQLEHLNKINFHPNLLPIILKNSDFIALTPQQVSAFKGWGKTNFKPMVATMNKILRERIAFQEAALSPSVSADTLRKKQEAIFQLHRKLLDYKLSCRENIIQTFNEENWEGFMMVLGEEGFPIPDNAGTSDFAAFPAKQTRGLIKTHSQPP